MTTVVVLDYGSGNLRSAERAVARAGAEVAVTTDAKLAAAANVTLVTVPGAVFLLPDEAPEQIAAVIADAVSKVP